VASEDLFSLTLALTSFARNSKLRMKILEWSPIQLQLKPAIHFPASLRQSTTDVMTALKMGLQKSFFVGAAMTKELQ
jgi:hypothetical protein